MESERKMRGNPSLIRLGLAIQFLTIVPIQITSKIEDRDLIASVRYYPVVGVLLGGVLSTILYYLQKGFAPLVAGLLVTLVWTLLTGGLHVDGLMDTADGLGSRKPRERMLEIMKDSRVGAMGAMAGCLSLLLKTTVLGTLLATPSVWLLLPIVTTGSRFAMVLATRQYPDARSGTGTGSLLSGKVTTEDVWGAAVFFIVFTLILLWLGLHAAPLVVLGALLVTGLLVIGFTQLAGNYLTGILGGLTGDTYGAICEFIEAVLLLTLAALQHAGGI